jgi:hypothetical protein
MRRNRANGNSHLVRENLRLVKQVYPDLTEGNLRSLRELTRMLGLSVSMGEIQYIDARWYVTLFKEWGVYRDAKLDYPKGHSWDKTLHQGVHLLHRFVQDDRIQIRQPKKNLQLKMTRSLGNGAEFVAYIDAIGELDGERYLIDWKTTTSRYSQEPPGLLALDPQLVCYSWISGISDVALVVFVRKNWPEIQYVKASITEEQRKEFGDLVHSAVEQIEGGRFLPHSGIRFPRNGCVSCSHLGLCLNNQPLINTNLIRRPGASDLDWLDELVD